MTAPTSSIQSVTMLPNETGPLIRFWRDNPDEVRKLSLRQIINLAGDGRMADDSACSNEFRLMLSEVDADDLERFVAECLERESGAIARKGFPDSGFVLQDVVNEIGRRLDFDVTNGVYHGRRGVTGFDGIWKDKAGRDLVVEVKTTDTYAISLDQVERYREELTAAKRLSEMCSILFVVGRDDTGALEAQIRGSRHAWTMRMIGATSLVRLLQVKVNAEAPTVVARIKSLLSPIEYTRIDGIVDLVFDVRADIDEPVPAAIAPSAEISVSAEPRVLTRSPSLPSAPGIEEFRKTAADILSEKLGARLIRRRRSLFEASDHGARAVIAVSKRYDREYQSYWYAFYDTQQSYLNDVTQGYLVLCALDTGRMWALPAETLRPLLTKMNLTTRPEGQTYRHVLTKMVGDDCVLLAGDDAISLHPYEVLPALPAAKSMLADS